MPVAKQHEYVEGKRDGRTLHKLRRMQPALLILLGLTGCLAAVRPAMAQDLAPIHRRFEVHRTEGGFELLGFRASVGQADRFILSAGMPAIAAREQMLSAGWAASYGLTDPTSQAFWGRRVRYQDVVEMVAVILDPTGRTVQTVTYERQPALYSRTGLLRYLYAEFRQGQVLVDGEDRILIEYGPENGQVLHVEATLLPGHQSQWRIIYRVDLAGQPALLRGESSGAGESGE